MVIYDVVARRVGNAGAGPKVTTVSHGGWGLTRGRPRPCRWVAAITVINERDKRLPFRRGAGARVCYFRSGGARPVEPRRDKQATIHNDPGWVCVFRWCMGVRAVDVIRSSGGIPVVVREPVI